MWIVNRAGTLYQLDLDSGKQLDVARVNSGSIWATPLYDGKHLFLFGQKGITSVLTLERGAEVAANSLWKAVAGEPQESSAGTGVQYAAAAADGYLLIRRGDRLFAIR